MSKQNRFLLDTQILLWFFSNELKKDALDVIKNPENEVYTSVVNAWEIILKSNKGKLRAPKDIKNAIKKSGFEILDLNLEHVLETEKLPGIHSDPFDRILIAQARVERLTLVSSDKKIGKYKVRLLKV